jgi:biotin synthase
MTFAATHGDHQQQSSAIGLRKTLDSRKIWTEAEATTLYEMPFNDLLFKAQTVHRQSFDPNRVQLSRLLSIKTGGCPEDCGYCSQSQHYESGLTASKLMEVERVVAEARKARDAGATRYCMGAAWRNPKPRDMEAVVAMVKGVKALGMETCMTLGMLDRAQSEALSQAGLDYYNHNIDTSERYYSEIITTRNFADRLETLENVRAAGMKVCCGGIVGMGESREDRVGMIHALATLPVHPESVPINMLVQVEGTPVSHGQMPDHIEFIRTIAVARITMPKSMVRLSAGRETMSAETQALCFLAGANSIFGGPKLLTTPNPDADRDHRLFEQLGLTPMAL